MQRVFVEDLDPERLARAKGPSTEGRISGRDRELLLGRSRGVGFS